MATLLRLSPGLTIWLRWLSAPMPLSYAVLSVARAFCDSTTASLKGATRFPIESNVAGATDLIIQHGINDIIHAVGTDVNPFRPWSDLPTVEEMERGVEDIYVKPAKAMGLKVWSGTLLPIFGWRTYNEDREKMRQAFNEWLRTSPIFDGDHLHPSERAYEAMAHAAIHKLVRSMPRYDHEESF